MGFSPPPPPPPPTPPPRKERSQISADSDQSHGIPGESRSTGQIPYFSPQFKARLKLLFSFKGRINRKQFMLGYLLKLVIMFVTGGLIALTDRTRMENYMLLPIILIFVIIVWLNISLLSRRLKDTGTTPWILILVLVPFLNALVGPVLLLLCMILPPEKRKNKYGDAPYDIF